MAKGMEERSRRRSAGKAAWAKKASEMLDQIAVARVLKPMGLRMRVAGSSFMQVRKTRAVAEVSPGRSNGNKTRPKTPPGVAPRLRAAHSRLGEICNKEARVEPTAWGMNRIT